MNAARIEHVDFTRIKPAAYNPRKDLQPGDPEYVKLERSIERWGLVEPLVWNSRTGNLIGGHQRYKVLKARGDTSAAVSVVDLDANEEAALNIALNKIAGDWDMASLSDLLSTLDANGYDATLTGFNTDELAKILGREPTGEPDSVPDVPANPVTKSGDLILLGNHRLLCGDSTSATEVARLMGDDRAGLMNVDPPYGVAYNNTNRPGVAKSSQTPAVENDDLHDAKLQAFLEAAFRAARGNALLANAAWYMWHAHLTQGFFAAAAEHESA